MIGLIGPHAIGKTSSVRRWCKKYPKLSGVLCDSGVLVPSEEKEKGWHGDAETKKALVASHRQDSGVIILEGCSQRSTAWVRCFTLEDYIVHVCCTPEMFESVMRTRCASKNKKYREDYWTSHMLKYDCQQRFDNYVRRNLQDFRVERFLLSNYSGWSEVDAWFGGLYCKLHNQLIQSLKGKK